MSYEGLTCTRLNLMRVQSFNISEENCYPELIRILLLPDDLSQNKLN